MTFVQMLKSALFQFDGLKNVRKAAFSKTIAFLLMLAVFLSIPTTIKALQIFKEIQTDVQNISEKIPDFTIKKGILTPESNTEGFIYQTNSIIFTFDPDGKRQAQDVASDLVGNLMSIGLLKNELVISLPASGITDTLLNGNQLVFSYNEPALTNLSGQEIRDTLVNQKIPWWIPFISFLIALYPTLLNLIITILISTLIGNLYARMKRYTLTFFENLKTIIVSATLPVIVEMFVELLLPDFDTTTFLIIATVFIFARGIRNSPKAPLPQ